MPFSFHHIYEHLPSCIKLAIGANGSAFCLKFIFSVTFLKHGYPHLSAGIPSYSMLCTQPTKQWSIISHLIWFTMQWPLLECLWKWQPHYNKCYSHKRSIQTGLNVAQVFSAKLQQARYWLLLFVILDNAVLSWNTKCRLSIPTCNCKLKPLLPKCFDGRLRP